MNKELIPGGNVQMYLGNKIITFQEFYEKICKLLKIK